MSPYIQTEDGFENQLATNFMGHFALTGLLIKRLINGQSKRACLVFAYELNRRLSASGLYNGTNLEASK